MFRCIDQLKSIVNIIYFSNLFSGWNIRRNDSIYWRPPPAALEKNTHFRSSSYSQRFSSRNPNNSIVSTKWCKWVFFEPSDTKIIGTSYKWMEYKRCEKFGWDSLSTKAWSQTSSETKRRSGKARSYSSSVFICYRPSFITK